MTQHQSAPKVRTSASLEIAPRVILALTAIYLLWGTSYLAIKQAGEDIPPLLLAGLRNLAAGAVLLAIARFQGRLLGKPSTWRNPALVGVMMIAVGAGLLARGMHSVPSGAASVLFAAVPVGVCVLLALLGQRISGAQWFGTALGVAGVLLLNADAAPGPGQQGMWMIMFAVVATAASAVMNDRLRMPDDVIVSTGIQMVAGGGAASVVGYLMGERLSSPSPQAWVAIAFLSLFVSVIGYVSYVYLIRHAGPVVASSYAYVNPPIALIAGAWFLGETLTPHVLLATCIVLAGAITVLAATRRATPTPTPNTFCHTKAP